MRIVHRGRLRCKGRCRRCQSCIDLSQHGSLKGGEPLETQLGDKTQNGRFTDTGATGQRRNRLERGRGIAGEQGVGHTPLCRRELGRAGMQSRRHVAAILFHAILLDP